MSTIDTLQVPYCAACHSKKDGAFCSQCGTPLVEGLRSCPCGYGDIWPHEKFCRMCGLPAGPMPTEPQDEMERRTR